MNDLNKIIKWVKECPVEAAELLIARKTTIDELQEELIEANVQLDMCVAFDYGNVAIGVPKDVFKFKVVDVEGKD